VEVRILLPVRGVVSTKALLWGLGLNRLDWLRGLGFEVRRQPVLYVLLMLRGNRSLWLRLLLDLVSGMERRRSSRSW
jgi:hypothetical protein